MSMNVERVAKECELCGKVYVPTGNNSKYCSRTCAKKAKRHNELIRAKELKKRKTSGNDKKIMEYAQMAKQAGMSYGEYVARTQYGKRG